MSYEQLAASVDALAEANRSLTEQSLETQAGSIAASDNATAKALEAAQAALSAEEAARVATDAANLAEGFSDNLITTWANTQNFRLAEAVRDVNGTLVTASIVWPDGTEGVFTSLNFNVEFQGAIDSWEVTYAASKFKTITQPIVTRDYNGAVVLQPPLIITVQD